MSLTITTGDSGTIEGELDADLTGATARANIRRPDRTVVSKDCTLTDAAAGEWSFAYTEDDFTQAGLYYVEVEVTYSSGAEQTFAHARNGRTPLTFLAREEIA